jgi:phosphomannomutase
VRDGEDGKAEILSAIDAVASSPPNQIGGYEVSAVVDYRVGAEERPGWLGAQPLVEFMLGDAGRVLTRPSGTEPKLKIYVDLRQDLGSSGGIHGQRNDLLENASELAEDLGTMLAESMVNS